MGKNKCAPKALITHVMTVRSEGLGLLHSYSDNKDDAEGGDNIELVQ